MGASREPIVIIGGGLIGLGTAHALLRLDPRRTVVVLEKESAPGQHQSTHNSGVLHAGLYYAPGSAKARLAVKGITAMTAFCREHAISHEICGKLVVAVSEDEIPRLKTLLERGTANGLQGLRWLSAAEANEIEPHVRCIAAVHVPQEGIVDYAGVVTAMVAEITEWGGLVRAVAPVTHFHRQDGRWVVRAGSDEIRARYIVNCAGLHSDRIAALAGEAPTCRIIPFRGEYFLLRPERAGLVRNLIYPVPHPGFPFLGVHYTRMIRGGVECGPNAVLALAREGYRSASINFGDMADALSFPGLWRFLLRHPGMTWHEVARSLSKTLFTHALQRLIPEVQEADLVPGGSGVRAQAMLTDGTLVQDFLLVQRPDALHVLNAPSPGATASLAIGEEIAGMVAGRSL